MRIALGIEYDGHLFYGWQTQTGLQTIQGCLEKALTQVADQPIQLFCAGRTDAGVHATGQVAHFDTPAIRKMRAWILGTNTNLPPQIAVRWAEEVDEHFHARYSALSRRYRYIIHNQSTRSAILAARVTWYYHLLNIERMQQAAKYLIGEHDFSSFRSAECESKTPMRNVHEIIITRHQDFVVIEIEANAFLHHMVRNIVGVLMEVGIGAQSPDWIHDVLLAKDRKMAAETAPAAGLYLTQVRYPAKYAFSTQRDTLFLV